MLSAEADFFVGYDMASLELLDIYLDGERHSY